MKEMAYGKRLSINNLEILDKGIYKGIPYWIISYGTHPCAYLDITDLEPCPQLDKIFCHGGITASVCVSRKNNHSPAFLKDVRRDAFTEFHENAYIIGWDYCHNGDYHTDIESPWVLRNNDHKWTTSEIIDETKDVIEDLTYGQDLASIYSCPFI